MIYTGLSGNELYCINKLGYKPGDLVIGNSVFSLGFVGGVSAGFRGMLGGEITRFTEIIAEGRRLSLERLHKELDERQAIGATGVTSELVMHPGNIEFLSIASALHHDKPGERFTSSADGQEFYCQHDANYEPVKFVFGNVAYSIGLARGFVGGLRTLVRGEVKEFSDIFTATRNLALERLVNEAKEAGANSVVGIETTILPFKATGVQEMLMIGTASRNTYIEYGNPKAPVNNLSEIVTSDLTCEELWNITNMGYIPYKLLLGTSVYSLGIAGGISSALKMFVKGEINELTTLIYDAREESLGKVAAEAKAIGADDVIGIKTYIYSLGGGLIEFLAIGTAVKKIGSQIKTRSDQLIPQAIIRDRSTFFNAADSSFGIDLNAATR